MNVFLEILQPDSGFIETISKATISSDVMGLTLKAIGMILSLPLNEHKKCFLQKIFDAKTYWKQIEGYMKELTIEQKPGKSKKKLIVATSDKEFWENLVVLCWNVTKCFKWDGKFVQKAAKMIVDSKHELKLNLFKEEFDKMFKKINDDSTVFNEIYPTLDELVSTESADIKPNIVQGKYPSVTHYLEVHLSLLREDFICPLREGITQFLSQAKDGSFKSNHNIKVYPKVQILTKSVTTTSRGHKGEFLMVDLDPESRNDPRHKESFPNFSKKLMYGSLVVFTTSIAFEDMILAVVSNRDTDLLNQGFVN